MKVKIIEKLNKNRHDGHNLPLSYRVSLISYNNGDIEFNKEYFRVGFNDGETWDKPFIKVSTYLRPSVRVSIMTRKLDDKKYLNSLDNKVVSEFIKTCNDDVYRLQKELIEETKRINENIELYGDLVKLIDSKFNRKKKIRKILNIN